MKKLLFISYSNDDFDKVELIEKELLKNSTFAPLVVARTRTANKALVAKVTDGIESSYCVIPILTKKSIKTQWINQEIGYAYGKGKSVIPVIQKSIIDDLKGFIHKNNDLPYLYSTRTKSGSSIGNENKDFMRNFRLLVKDLEKEIKPIKPLTKLVSQGTQITYTKIPVLPKNIELLTKKKPLGTIASSGDPCPETGIWQVQNMSLVERSIKKGEILPYLGLRPNLWKLIRYL